MEQAQGPTKRRRLSRNACVILILLLVALASYFAWWLFRVERYECVDTHGGADTRYPVEVSGFCVQAAVMRSGAPSCAGSPNLRIALRPQGKQIPFKPGYVAGIGHPRKFLRKPR